jgi:D-3-phosphoglycerate dehydrogenase
MTEKPLFKVVITDSEHGYIDPEIEILGAVGADVELHNCQNEEDVIEAAADADGLIVGYSRITARVLDALPKCRVVSRYGIGLDVIDVEAATQRGVVVTNTPDFCLDEVADHTMALLLTLARRVMILDRAVRDGRAVKEGTRETLRVAGPMYRLSRQALGVIGLGQIGRSVVKRAQAFGMRILSAPDPAVSTEEAAALGTTVLSLDEILAEADYVTLHVPLLDSTRHLINADRLALMKPSAAIINTSRGPVIDEAALIDALRDGRLAGAGLDVYENEPISPDNPLRTMENVVLSSHAAWYSEDSMRDVKVKAAQAVADLLQGRVPGSVVNPSALASSDAD